MVYCCCVTSKQPARSGPAGGPARGPAGVPAGGPAGVPAGGQGRVGGQHDEEVCHCTGERRRDLLDQVKIFLNEFDERPCEVSPPPTAGQSPTKRLGHYEEYLRKHCQSWMPDNPRPPIITSIQTHEIRPTEDYERMRINNNEYVTYVDGRVKPPPLSCDCAKRNGLQDRCDRPECKPPTAQCLATNPGPCCPPSMGLTGRADSNGRNSFTGPGGYGVQQNYNVCIPNQPNQYTSHVPQQPPSMGQNMHPPPFCACAKQNGFQDHCDRPECKPPTAQCLATNPGPCCHHFMGFTGRADSNGRNSFTGPGGYGAQQNYNVCIPNQPNQYTSHVPQQQPSMGQNMPPAPSCDCAKRNGLQDQVERPECNPPTAQYIATNPSPDCHPSMGLTGRTDSNGRSSLAGHSGYGQHFFHNQPNQYMPNVSLPQQSPSDDQDMPPPRSCGCTKRNGLQDQCDRPDCNRPLLNKAAEFVPRI